MHTKAHDGRRLLGLGSMSAAGLAAALVWPATASAQQWPAPTSAQPWAAPAGAQPMSQPMQQPMQQPWAAPGAAMPGAAPGAAMPGTAPPAGASGEAPKSDVYEDPLKRYYFLGVRFRDAIVPKFMMEIFATGGTTGNAWMIGPELSTRKGNTEIDVSLMYADYGVGPMVFHGKSEQEVATEIVTSEMKIGYLTFDLLLDVPIDKSGYVSFLIGGGVGIGVVAGDLRRVQAYPSDDGTGVPDANDPNKKWKRCNGVGDPDVTYCDNGNDHYVQPDGKDYSEKSWADGGSKPVVFPWLALPQLSLRVKPAKHFQTRVDAGFSLSGFFFGLSAGYGF